MNCPKIHGPAYTTVLTNLHKYYLEVNNFNKFNIEEARSAKIFYQFCINTAVNRHRARLHRNKAK